MNERRKKKKEVVTNVDLVLGYLKDPNSKELFDYLTELGAGKMPTVQYTREVMIEKLQKALDNLKTL